MNTNFLFFLGHLVLTKIDNYTVLDCSLISPPEITENHLDLNLKVTIVLEHPSGYGEYLEDKNYVQEKMCKYARQAISFPIVPASCLHPFKRLPNPFLVGK